MHFLACDSVPATGPGGHLVGRLEDDTIVQRGQEGPSNRRGLLEELGEEGAVGLQLVLPAAVLSRGHVGFE